MSISITSSPIQQTPQVLTQSTPKPEVQKEGSSLKAASDSLQLSSKSGLIGGAIKFGGTTLVGGIGGIAGGTVAGAVAGGVLAYKAGQNPLIGVLGGASAGTVVGAIAGAGTGAATGLLGNHLNKTTGALAGAGIGALGGAAFGYFKAGGLPGAIVYGSIAGVAGAFGGYSAVSVVKGE